MIFGDNITRCWKQIIYHGGEREEVAEGEEMPAPEQGEGHNLGLILDEGLQLISDGRGVRLAREEEGDD